MSFMKESIIHCEGYAIAHSFSRRVVKNKIQRRQAKIFSLFAQEIRYIIIGMTPDGNTIQLKMFLIIQKFGRIIEQSRRRVRGMMYIDQYI
jgi:hypothetical protein